MKVREREGAKAGGYDVIFKELIRKQNKVGLSAPKDGKPGRAMFRLTTSDEKVTVPYSFPWDPEHPYFGGTLGALGVNPAKLGDLSQVEQALIKFEKIAKAKALPCNVYVREDGGFGASLKPLEGKFIVEFTRIASRDQETDAPIHKRYTKDRFYKKSGTTEHIDEEQYQVEMRIITGSRKGALLRKTLTYNIVKNDADEWEIDGESTARHAEASRWMTLHKTPKEKIDPDKHFEDSENGLPELEVLWLKHKRPLEVTVSGGFANAVKEPPDISTDDESEDVGDQFAADPELVGTLYDKIDKKVKAAYGHSAWLGDSDRFSKYGQAWMKKYVLPIMRRKNMFLDIHKLTDDQIKTLLNHFER